MARKDRGGRPRIFEGRRQIWADLSAPAAADLEALVAKHGTSKSRMVASLIEYALDTVDRSALTRVKNPAQAGFFPDESGLFEDEGVATPARGGDGARSSEVLVRVWGYLSGAPHTKLEDLIEWSGEPKIRVVAVLIEHALATVDRSTLPEGKHAGQQTLAIKVTGEEVLQRAG